MEKVKKKKRKGKKFLIKNVKHTTHTNLFISKKNEFKII